jgi:CHAT domain-containing protein/Tfp pilus assembly protein PilF
LRRHGTADDPEVAASHSRVAQCLERLGRPREALSEYEAAVAMLQRIHGGRDDGQLARCLNNLGQCHKELGASAQALLQLEAALAMRRRLHAGGDHAEVATTMNNVGLCLLSLGRAAEARSVLADTLAMLRRLHGEADHADVAVARNNIALCLVELGDIAGALAEHEATLAMRRRLFGDKPHSGVATSLHNVASMLERLGRARDALPVYEEALAAWRGAFGGREHQRVAMALENLAYCLRRIGRTSEALTLAEEALAMYRSVFGGRDHPAIASCESGVGQCLEEIGRAAEALTHFEASLAMERRLHGSDHHGVWVATNNVAFCLQSMGRAHEALPRYQAALAGKRRLSGDRDTDEVAHGHNNLGTCLQTLGRPAEALEHLQAALAMWQRLHAGRDHPDVAASLNNVGACAARLGRGADALRDHDAALAMRRRLVGDADHPSVVTHLGNRAAALRSLGRDDEALADDELALAMCRRLFGEGDHPDIAIALTNVVVNLHVTGRTDEALAQAAAALAMWQRLYGDAPHPSLAIAHDWMASLLQRRGDTADAVVHAERCTAILEQIRGASRTLSLELRQSFFDELKKRGGAFERLQRLHVALGNATAALAAAERSRARQLLDLLELQAGDPLDEAERRAALRGDAEGAQRIAELRRELQSIDAEDDRMMRQLRQRTSGADAASLQELRARLEELGARRRSLLDEHARHVADVVSLGRPRTVAEIQAALQAGERLLEYSVDESGALLWVVPPAGGAVTVHELRLGASELQRHVDAWTAQLQTTGAARGRDPQPTEVKDGSAAARTLFAALVPPVVWEQVRSDRRVFVAAQRALHRLPFETLLVGDENGRPLHWLDAGPPIAYVPSGSALHWLRQRKEQQRDDATALDLVAVGDPSAETSALEPPELGALVLRVRDDGEGARAGLRAGDVLVAYDGGELADDAALRLARTRVVQAIDDGTRAMAPVALRAWRAGVFVEVAVQPGLLGIDVAPGRARDAWQRGPADEAAPAVTRRGDLERLGRMPPLAGARAEVAAIAGTFKDRERVRTLQGHDASEAAVRDLAPRARLLHFACHGIAEEYAGQSLSMLMLAPPASPFDQDDGCLRLTDLLQHWRARLASTQLVVLSACRTGVGPIHRDDAPHALPVGFLFAGAASVVSSLWAVDDASTAELMRDFYRRLADGAPDRLEAFTQARRALRQKHPHPYHWAPFLYLGDPQ